VDFKAAFNQSTQRQADLGICGRAIDANDLHFRVYVA